jgi:hypothetical protein
VQGAIDAQESGGTPPDAAAVAGTLPQIAADAGTTLFIRNTFLDAPDINATLDGRIQADAQALMKTAGTMTLSVRGLDELLLKFQDLSAGDPQAANAARSLVFFQMMGQAEKTPDGKPPAGKSVRRYNLELTRDGRMLLNGSDFSALAGVMGAGMGGAAPPPAPPPPPGLAPPETAPEEGAAP